MSRISSEEISVGWHATDLFNVSIVCVLVLLVALKFKLRD